MVCSFPNFTALFDSGIRDEIVRRLIRPRLCLVFTLHRHYTEQGWGLVTWSFGHWTTFEPGRFNFTNASLSQKQRLIELRAESSGVQHNNNEPLSVAAHLSRQEALQLSAQHTPPSHRPLTESLKLVVSWYFPRQLVGPTSCLPRAGLSQPGLGPVVGHTLDILSG